MVANFGQSWCTATGVSSPSGGLFDAAIDTGDGINGPESVDENNGWMHFYSPGTSAIAVTWSEACSQAQGSWAGRVAAFMPGGSVAQQPAPPTLLKAVVN